MTSNIVVSNQIPLPFGNYEKIDFDLFQPGENIEAVNQLRKAINDGAANVFYIWGMPGTGKSHLLQAACTLAASNLKRAAYIPLAEFENFTPELLQGLEQLDIVCIDDMEKISGRQEWELALFHVYNRLRDDKRIIVLASNSNPLNIEIELADLKSRLSWGVTYHLQALNEQDCLVALQARAQIRGFSIPDDVGNYLVKRVTRDIRSLLSILNKLDEASLAAGKKLTIPFVKKLLEIKD